MGIPVALTWASVLAEVSNFMAEPLVISAITVSLAFVFIPRLWKTIKKTVGR